MTAKSVLDELKTLASPSVRKVLLNSFVICVGSYVKPLMELAIATADAIGPVEVDMGATACQVPSASDYIRKVEARGAIGKKRKSVKC